MFKELLDIVVGLARSINNIGFFLIILIDWLIVIFALITCFFKTPILMKKSRINFIINIGYLTTFIFFIVLIIFFTVIVSEERMFRENLFISSLIWLFLCLYTFRYLLVFIKYFGDGGRNIKYIFKEVFKMFLKPLMLFFFFVSILFLATAYFTSKAANEIKSEDTYQLLKTCYAYLFVYKNAIVVFIIVMSSICIFMWSQTKKYCLNFFYETKEKNIDKHLINLNLAALELARVTMSFYFLIYVLSQIIDSHLDSYFLKIVSIIGIMLFLLKKIKTKKEQFEKMMKTIAIKKRRRVRLCQR